MVVKASNRLVSISYLILVAIVLPDVSHPKEEWQSRDPENDAKRLLKSESGPDWIARGRFDLDEDGDLDVILVHESLAANKDEKTPSLDRCRVYINNNGEYTFSRKETYFPCSKENIAFVPVRNTKGNAALIYFYKSESGGIEYAGVWLEKNRKGWSKKIMSGGRCVG